MKLKSFEIIDFRSIRNTKCQVSPRITLLAGKNESGKTNILEALDITTNSNRFKETDKPNWSKKADPKVNLTYTINENEINTITSCLSNLGLSSYKKSLKNFNKICSKEFTLTKTFEKNTYWISGPFYTDCQSLLTQLLVDISDLFNKNLLNLKERRKDIETIKQLEQVLLNDEDIKHIENVVKKQISLLNQIEETNPDLDIVSIKMNLNDLEKILNSLTNLMSELRAIIPKFILFSSFDDTIPYKVQINKIRDAQAFKNEYRIVSDLFRLANLEVEVFNTEDDLIRSTEVKKASKVYSKNFGEFWNQVPIEISIEDKMDHICIWINDVGFEERLLRPEQRSKVLQWYMSFFIRLKSEGFDNSIILIDEPGANLHAKAQEDVLSLLDDISKNNQVIFATHSPFLIDSEKLQRVRLVSSDITTKETYIENNFNKGSDYDTLTPIITRLGLDISRTLAFSKDINILMEGVSDYYYITTVLNYLRKHENYEFPDKVGFLPGVGHTQISHLISILFGWGIDYIILLDKKGTTKTYNKLVKDGIDETQIILIGEKQTDSIEDLFSIQDIKKYNLKDFEERKAKEHKETKMSKSIIAKQFAQKANKKEFTLTKKSLTNFRKIFDNIKNKIYEMS
ncbi:MAG: AAA family ATPase [Candidatus Heimdallarchaeota archaeon]